MSTFSPEPPSPTITHYKAMADAFIREFDLLVAGIPNLEASHIATFDFARSLSNVPIPFLGTTVSAVEQTPDLQAVNKLDVAKALDTLQFLDAFRPVFNRVHAFGKDLQFTMMSRKASLSADCLQIYDIAQGLARDPGSAALGAHVQNMKRDLGRSRPSRRAPAPPTAPPPAPPKP